MRQVTEHWKGLLAALVVAGLIAGDRGIALFGNTGGLILGLAIGLAILAFLVAIIGALTAGGVVRTSRAVVRRADRRR